MASEKKTLFNLFAEIIKQFAGTLEILYSTSFW
jgi:hypothetical protein